MPQKSRAPSSKKSVRCRNPRRAKRSNIYYGDKNDNHDEDSLQEDNEEEGEEIDSKDDKDVSSRHTKKHQEGDDSDDEDDDEDEEEDEEEIVLEVDRKPIDVTFGRGGPLNELRKRNVLYQGLLEKHSEDYRKIKSVQKAQYIHKHIIQAIHQQGGRFLEKKVELPTGMNTATNNSTSSIMKTTRWVVVKKVDVITKTLSQALRDMRKSERLPPSPAAVASLLEASIQPPEPEPPRAAVTAATKGNEHVGGDGGGDDDAGDDGSASGAMVGVAVLEGLSSSAKKQQQPSRLEQLQLDSVPMEQPPKSPISRTGTSRKSTVDGGGDDFHGTATKNKKIHVSDSPQQQKQQQEKADMQRENAEAAGAAATTTTTAAAAAPPGVPHRLEQHHHHPSTFSTSKHTTNDDHHNHDHHHQQMDTSKRNATEDMRNEIRVLHEENDAFMEENQNLHDQVATLQQQNQKLVKALNAVRAENTVLVEENDELIHELQALRNSTGGGSGSATSMGNMPTMKKSTTSEEH